MIQKGFIRQLRETRCLTLPTNGGHGGAKRVPASFRVCMEVNRDGKTSIRQGIQGFGDQTRDGAELQRSAGATNLGVNQTTLQYWLTQHHRQDGAAAMQEDRGLRKRVRELEAENLRLKMEREILKKAAAFFAREPQS